jgi:hypothetical protein
MDTSRDASSESVQSGAPRSPSDGGARRWLTALVTSAGVTAVGVGIAGAVDLAIGHFISAPLYIPVVFYVAWTGGCTGAVLASCACTATRALLDRFSQSEVLEPGESAMGWNMLARLSIYLAVAITVASLRRVIRERDRLVGELRIALNDVSTLRGLLPMCAWCKQIRDDREGGTWVPLERYLAHRTSATVSHGICPRCAKAAFDHPPTND